MATRLLGRVKERVMETGAELGARVASRALDAAEAMDRARLNVGRLRENGPERLRAAARKVPVVGKRLDQAPEALRAAAARVPVLGKRLGASRGAVSPETKRSPAAPTVKELQREAREGQGAAKQKQRSVEVPRAKPTPLQFTPVGASPDFKGRKVVTSRGRKTIAAAAAKRVRAKAHPEGFKAKRGQKKRH